MTRIDLGAKPLLYPMPVLIIGTYDKDGNPNAMNAAWGSITDFDEISISLSKHKTTDNFNETNAFTVSIATSDYMVASDYVGIESGNSVPDKFFKAGFTHFRSSRVNAPIINELPIALECEVKSFDDGILIGKILNVCVDESVMTDGKVDPSKVKPIIYDPFNNTYMSLGEVVGEAFKAGNVLKK